MSCGRGVDPAGRRKALDIRNGVVVDADTGRERIGLDEVARIAYFRPDTLPPGFQAELMATRHYVPRAYAFAFTNGAQASWLEVDTDTGFIKLLKHWCVEDCGTVINPQLVDEQVRGGVVQGLGAVLFEHCLYDERGQMLNGNMADYLVPMAAEMPDIEVGHVVTPTADSNSAPRARARPAPPARRPRDERRERRAGAARRQADHRDADHADGGAAGARQGVIAPRCGPDMRFAH
jgi:CO/xanthine dehydrogenase Mo-binding subunit